MALEHSSGAGLACPDCLDQTSSGQHMMLRDEMVGEKYLHDGSADDRGQRFEVPGLQRVALRNKAWRLVEWDTAASPGTGNFHHIGQMAGHLWQAVQGGMSAQSGCSTQHSADSLLHSVVLKKELCWHGVLVVAMRLDCKQPKPPAELQLAMVVHTTE
jgi:hypothetical protein